MRIALFSDVHGNSVALDAVLADIEAKGGVDAYWLLGDLVAVGPDPIGVMKRLLGLTNAVFTRGNTDRYVVTGERPAPTPDQVRNDPNLLELYQEVTNCFAWTQGALAVSGFWIGWRICRSSTASPYRAAQSFWAFTLHPVTMTVTV